MILIFSRQKKTGFTFNRSHNCYENIRRSHQKKQKFKQNILKVSINVKHPTVALHCNERMAAL